MAETLFVRLGRSQLQWCQFDSFGREAVQGEGSHDDFRQAFEGGFGGDVIAIVSGEDVLLTTAAVPSRQPRQIAQAVPYVVEEELARDPEDCFFAIGDHTETGAVRVCVVDDALMVSWKDQLAALGLVPSFMLSETELVTGASHCQAVIDGERVHVGSPDHRGVTLPVADFALATSLLDSTGGTKVLVNQADRPGIELALSELKAAGQEVSVEETVGSGFETLVGLFDARRTNLLQGRHRIEVEKNARGSVWRSVAVLAAIAVALHLLMLTGQGWYLSSKASQYERDALALYKSVFPADRNIRDIRRRWNAHLGRSGGPDGNPFLALFSQSSHGLGSAGLTLQNVNFNESRGDLILQVLGPRSETLVQYAQQLSGQGLEAEIGTISQDEGGVRGSIKVRMRGS